MQAVINILLNFVKRSDEPGQKKKKKDEGILLRPIICICNDQWVCMFLWMLFKDFESNFLFKIINIFHFPPVFTRYVPALRQLRMNALVINFPQTEPARLASRLSEVNHYMYLKRKTNFLKSRSTLYAMRCDNFWINSIVWKIRISLNLNW